MANAQVPNMDATTLATSSVVCFQQWYPSPFTDTSLPSSPRFPASAHYMTYRKALLSGNEVVAAKILASEAPGEAKILGGQAWECHGIVKERNFLKFSQHLELKEVLLGAGSKVIVEASPTDRIWGIGCDAEHADGKEAELGANKLGEVLMRVRESLRREEEVNKTAEINETF